MDSRVEREWLFDATESETPRTCGNSMRENRETPEVPPPDGGGGRPEKAYRRTSGMHVSGESDDPIVPTNPTNKTGQPAAELEEGRGSTKGNARQTAAYRAQDRVSVSIGLEGVRQAARRDKATRFSPLLANIYLHYVLDLWVEWWRNHRATGDVIIIRYADDGAPRTCVRKRM